MRTIVAAVLAAFAFGAVDCFAAPVFDTENGKYTYDFPHYVIDTPAGASNTLASAAFTITKYESAEDEVAVDAHRGRDQGAPRAGLSRR